MENIEETLIKFMDYLQDNIPSYRIRDLKVGFVARAYMNFLKVSASNESRSVSDHEAKEKEIYNICNRCINLNSPTDCVGCNRYKEE